MTIIHIPSRGEDDPEIGEIFIKGALPEHATVPLTVFVDGKHHVIGEATVNGEDISAVLSQPVAEEVMDLIMGRPEDVRFSIGFRLPPYPFTEKPPYVF